MVDGTEIRRSGPAIATASFTAARHIPFDAPWLWLASGWRDLWSVPAIGLTHGFVFVLAALAIVFGLWHAGALVLFPTLAGGFLLIAPLLVTGLYETSRRLARGEPVSLGQVALAGLAAKGQIAFFGVALMIAFLVWMQLAFFLLMLFLGGRGLPPPADFMSTLLMTGPGLGLLVTGSIVGGVLAAVVFSISAIAVPMLLCEPVDAVSAMRASVETVIGNPRPMALWAALIAGLTFLGFVTMFAGLVVVIPLIGHATWHAYAEARAV